MKIPNQKIQMTNECQITKFKLQIMMIIIHKKSRQCVNDKILTEFSQRILLIFDICNLFSAKSGSAYGGEF